MKILIVEDDKTVIQSLNFLLSSHHYAVDIATNGETALDMVENFHYDLLLLDICLPKLDGISLCQQLRQGGCHVPILLLTAQEGSSEKAIALNAGADDYMVKPFDVEELIARIQALLRRRKSKLEPILQWGNLSLDRSNYSVSYKDNLLSLRPKEFAILELFLRNPHQVLSTQKIIEQVWILAQTPSEESVRGHIKELRKKLRTATAPKNFIKTVRGTGYQLNPLYCEQLADPETETLTAPKIAELKAINEELRTTVETLQSAQEEQTQQNQELELSDQSLEQESPQLQIVSNKLETSLLEQFTEITQAIHQNLDVEEIWKKIPLERLRQFLDTDRIIIFRFQPDNSGKVIAESVLSEGISLLGLEITDPYFVERYREFYCQERISVITDISAPNVETFDRELMAQFQARAHLITPIMQGENVWGLLIAQNCFAPRQWKIKNIELLQLLATQLGIAIQQSELYQQNAEQAALINIASDAIFVRDLDNKILFWSKGAERLYGWTAEEAVGQIAHELFETEKLSELEIGLRKVIEKGSWQGELMQQTKSGQLILVASRWTLVQDSNEELKRLLIVNTDITEMKSLETQFYQTQRLDSLGALASGIAHDLNNILTPILSLAQTLRLQKCSLNASNSEHMLQLIENSAKKGADLLKQILIFARGGDGEKKLVDVTSVLTEVVKIIKQTLPKSIEINDQYLNSNDFQDLKQKVLVDPIQLHQVLLNLCINARDAMPTGGTLSLTIANEFIDETRLCNNMDAQRGNYIVITIADTGIGISSEIREHIFEPFFTTKAVDKGTGLGLSTALGIIKSYGGFIEVLSEVGQGTQMRVFLPAIEALPTEDMTTIYTDLEDDENYCILIVDDDHIVQKSTQFTLESYHYKTLVASDGIEAISLYKQHQSVIKLVLVDIMMPNMDGISLIQTLKSINPQVKIIAFSGVPIHRKSALAAGANVFLSKPYSPETLLRHIESV